jgi:protein-ribulosamine 3-kinase
LVGLPSAVRAEIEAALGHRIEQAAPVSGGCINSAARLATGLGPYFLKWCERGAAPTFEAESRALECIRATNTVRAPLTVARGDRWLLLEWLEPGQPSRVDWVGFGRQLAAMHRVKHTQFGGSEANFIGSLTQENGWSESWPAFWETRRLRPQLELALQHGRLGRADTQNFDRLFSELDDRLAVGQQDGASLLHGDLWSGNAHACSDGIALVDPSVYHGHREVDLAMAELFGGFPSAFREGYESQWPLQAAGWPQRRAIYQLYYLLVHINLFGSGYVAGTRNALALAMQ